MIVNMYSYLPFPQEFRSTFEIPRWPYVKETFADFKKYMLDLSVFSYEDSVMEDDDGSDINYFINFDRKDVDKPFLAYYNSLVVSDDELRVIKWPADKEEGFDQLRLISEDDTASDMYAWFSWNVAYEITYWSENMIGRKIIPEMSKIISISEPKCMKKNASVSDYGSQRQRG